MAEGDTIEEGVLEQLVQKLTPCIGRGELDACVEEAARLAGELGMDAPALLRLAGQMGKKGEYELAYVLALGAVNGLDGSKKAQAYSNAGLAANFLGNVGKAEIHHLKAIEADPTYAIAHYNYAILLEESNRKDEAQVYYLKAIKANPKCAAAHNNYALLLKESNRKSEAETHYRNAIEANPNYVTAHNNYAILLEEFNRYGEAETHYRKAIEIDSNYAEAYSNYAILLGLLDRKVEADAYYRKAIEIDPNCAAAHTNYANLLRERGIFTDAEKEVRIALQIAQDDYSSQDILPYAYGTLGDILAEEDYYKEAEREYQRALDKSNSMDNSSISNIHNNLGWVYTKMKKCKKAKAEFKKACGLDSMNIKARRNLRVLGRTRFENEPNISVIQIFLGSVLFLLLILTYAMFFIATLSEATFVAQSTIYLLLIFILFNIIQKFKFDKNGIEVEQSTGHMYNMSVKASMRDTIPIIER